MSNYLRSNDDAARQTTSAAGRRKLWLATGVLGLTGAVSLTGVAYGVGGVNGPADPEWSTAQQYNDDDKRNEEGRAWHEGQGPGAGNWNEEAWGGEQRGWRDDKGRGEHGKDDKGRGERGKDGKGRGEDRDRDR
ncbi:hypothetical protein ACTMSW_30675, partial [Micromonospora sp. BQ11]